MTAGAAVAAGSSRPAQRLDRHGRAHVDLRAMFQLAAPLMASNAVQAVINLTDTWFIGRISTQAVAAISSIYWIMMAAILVLGGVGLAVQTFVSQAVGSRRRPRAALATWCALWATLATWPAFIALAFAGRWLLRPFGLDPEIEQLALDYWQPRMGGAAIGAAAWALMGFFNGISATRYTVLVVVIMTLANLPANEVLIFRLDMGMAGAAWGTNIAQLCGLLVAGMIFLGPKMARRFRTPLMWRPRWSIIRSQLALGIPIGIMYGADVIGVALAQLMVVQATAVGAAATQVVMMLTSLVYMPTLGIATAGTTLVGQSIGAGDRAWAGRLGNVTIALCACMMGGVALLLLLTGEWLVPQFLSATDEASGEAAALALTLLWPAAAYQIFDGLYFGSSFSLRGAGDTRVPALAALLLSWLFYVPLAHTLIFAPGQGWIDGLPQLGFGAIGAWYALMSYATLLGTILLLRWRSGRWRGMRIN
ncbi:MAG: MATE family efflux transporter [Steroidobacteraceae bacterium]